MRSEPARSRGGTSRDRLLSGLLALIVFIVFQLMTRTGVTPAFLFLSIVFGMVAAILCAWQGMEREE